MMVLLLQLALILAQTLLMQVIEAMRRIKEATTLTLKTLKREPIWNASVSV